MARTNLRQLSRQYARGAINRADYRQRRAELIDSILAAAGNDGQPTGPGPDTREDGEPDTDVPPASGNT